MVGLEEIRASYPPAKAWSEMSGDLPAYLFYRPLSFYVTLPLARANVPSNAVTATCALIALSLPAFAFAIGPKHDYLVVAALAFAFSLLDCVDGNLARLRGRASRLGALFDAATDAVFWCALFFAMGLLVQKRAGWLAPHAVAIGLGGALLTLLGRRIRDEFRELYATRAEMPEKRPAKVGLGQWLFMGVAGLEHAYAAVVLIAGATATLDVALASVFAYAALVFVASLAIVFFKASRSERSH